MNPNLVSIIMVTRNRPVSLEQCLARTRAVLPPDVRIIVYDDASTEMGRVRAIIESHHNTSYLRSETLVGPGEGRNQCLWSVSTPFCLSLDDDCYLDSIPDLSRWLANRREDRDIAAVGFRYRNLPAGDLAPVSSLAGETDAFLGGASLLRRAAMARMGGYLDWLVFAREDTELSMRLSRLGYRIWYDPSVVIQHARSAEGRNWYWGSFYYVRNTLVINAIHGGRFTGVLLGIAKALRLGMFYADRRSATWAGIWAGLRSLPKCFQARKHLFSNSKAFSSSITG
jgi:GT2 family glycosyltransferase